MRIYAAALLPLLICLSAAGQGISGKGTELSKAYNAMEVESHWLKGRRVNWETGAPLPGDRKGGTHCSAFAAAACERLGVYILRPPEHGQQFLANAQHDWLLKSGKGHGWRRVESMEEAQRLANEGEVVAAVFRSPDGVPGHVALVRPSEKPSGKVAEEGPDIIQAGGTNWNRTSLKEGFKLHKGAFSEGKILFFSHAWTGMRPQDSDM